MRLWSVHPRYLDGKGLIALWREALLAQAVLRGVTRGYRHHPQLERFRGQSRPLGCMGTYLRVVWEEGRSRGYALSANKVSRARSSGRLAVTRGQLEYEWRHLRRKLSARAPAWLAALGDVARPQAHPLFRVVPGGVEGWERGADAAREEEGA
jgi:hypothetical protein